jgi:hypothetical protein
MLKTTSDTGAAHQRAATHRAVLSLGPKRPDGTPQPGATWVQVRKLYPGGPLVSCGTVAELTTAADGRELFKVTTPHGTVWAEGRNVRLCSGDGRCTCEPEQPPPSTDRQTKQPRGLPGSSPGQPHQQTEGQPCTRCAAPDHTEGLTS